MPHIRKSTLLTLLLSLFVLGTVSLPLSTAAAEAQSVNGIELSGVKQKEGKRIALVVGVDEYPEVPLVFPVRDAKLVTKQLESVGFEVIPIENPTLGALVEAREKFIKKINKSGEDVTALFFFAGHAVQFDGHNYLIPAKSQLLPSANNSFTTPGPAAFIDRGMDAQMGILNYLNDSKASKIIFVLDACRVNPYRPDHRSSTRANGLLRMNAKSDRAETFILFAASPGEVALDGGATAFNSPFTQSFANAIAQPGSSLAAVYQQVSDQVQKSTNKKQRPYLEGSLFSFMFREPAIVPVVSTGQNKMISTGFEKRDYDLAADGVTLLRKILEKKSVKEILSAAEGGDPEAQYLAAVAYNLGEGVPKDLTKTGYWLRRSSVRGFSRAQFFYGSLLFYGEGGIEPNPGEGMEWWQVAAENGNVSSLIRLGDAYRFGEKVKENLEKAEQYYQRALSSGLKDAETSLGYLYGTYATRAKKKGDLKAFEQANEKRLTYFQNSAQKGSSSGMYQLAYMYHYGDYVKADLQKAIQWYEKSISAGNSDAAEALAKLYVDESQMGKGKSKPDMAAKYFRVAMQLGSKSSGFELAELIKNNKDIFKASDEAIKLYEQALSDGSLRAASSLSDIYMKGELVSKDFKKAEQYALKTLELKLTTKPDSEDAWPLYIRKASFNLLQLYKKEGLRPTTPELVEKLALQVGTLDGNMKRFTVPITCGSLTTAFDIYVWDSGLDEPPTTEQFTWLEKAKGCEVSKDIVESFQKLYKIARDNKVSFQELTVYALGEVNKKPKK